MSSNNSSKLGLLAVSFSLLSIVFLTFGMILGLSQKSISHKPVDTVKTKVDTFYNMNGDMITITKKVKTSK